MTDLSRRGFVIAGSAFLSTASSLGQSLAAQLTVGDVIARIKREIGVPWREKTVDKLLTGSPDTPVQR